MATLSISFTPAASPPANGYRLHYRPGGSADPYTVHPTNFTSSPAVVTGLVAQDYEGFLESDCGGGVFSTPAAFESNDFNCPNVGSFALSTASGYIQIDSVTWQYTPTSNQLVTAVIKDNVTGQMLATIFLAVLPSGVILDPVPARFTGLVDGRSYDVTLSNLCNDVPVTLTFTCNSGALTEWVENTYTCEQDSVFTLASDYTGFSSPGAIMYDAPTGKLYVADYDDPNGNIYYIDPAAFTGFADIHRLAVLTGIFYTVVADPQYRRLYFTGRTSGGLKVFDIASGTVSTVAYGVDGPAFNRVMVSVLNTLIYVHDSGAGTITIIDRATLVVQSTLNITSIPSGATYFDSFRMLQVGSEIWVCSEFRGNGQIGVYNAALTSLITTITLPGVATETSSRFRQTQYFDQVNNKFYLSDGGSAQLFVLDGTSRAVVDTKHVDNLGGKAFGIGGYVVDPITGDLFLSYSAYNGPADGAPILRVYKINRSTYAIESMYAGQSFASLAQEGATNKIWGTFAGQFQWGGVSTYNTDGKISKYTR